MNFINLMVGAYILGKAYDKADFWLGCGATALICMSIMLTLFDWYRKDMKNARNKANNISRPY